MNEKIKNHFKDLLGPHDLLFGSIHITTTVAALDEFLNQIYNYYYNDQKIKHITSNDIRIPRIKITDDLMSTTIFLKERTGFEYKITLDGTVNDETITLNSIMLNVDDMLISNLNELIHFFSHIMNEHDVFYFAINDIPYRLILNQVESRNDMIKLLYRSLAPKEKTKHEEMYDWLLD